MTLFVVWYERKADFTPDSEKQHHGTITGETAANCMEQFCEFKFNHDLAKYTIPEIVWVYD